MGTLRDQILNADDVRRQTVVIPAWGDAKIEVRSLTVKEQYALMVRCRKPDGEIDPEMLAIETVIAASYDPETGDRVFDPADRDVLLKKSSRAFQTLLAAANTAAGLNDVDETAQDLEASPAADTFSG